MNVIAVDERRDKRFISAHMRQHPQLYLRIVSADELIPLACDERAAYLPSKLRSHRNILKVRIL